MKNTLWITAAVVAAASCTGTDRGRFEQYQGVYTAIGTNEYKTVYDTVEIWMKPGATGVFEISKRAVFRYKEIEGATPSDKADRLSWDGLYRPEQKVIKGPEPGISLSFDLGKGELYYAGKTYKRVSR